MANILIVDDEVILIELLRNMLPEIGHTTIDSATSGIEAVEKSKLLKPDLVLMDINMPGEMNGISAGKIIEQELEIPTIFITAHSFEYYRPQIENFGTFGYIVKPFDPKQLETAIYIALFRSQTEKSLKKLIKKYKLELSQRSMMQYLINQFNEEFDPYLQLKETLDNSASYIPVDGITIYQCDPGNQNDTIIFSKIYERLVVQKELPEQFELERSKDTNKLENHAFIKISNNLPVSVRQAFSESGIRFCFYVPIIIQEKLAGFIIYYFKTPKSFGFHLRNFLKMVTESISLAIKRHQDLMKIYQIEAEKKIQESMILRAEQLVSFSQLTSAIAHEIRQPLQSIKVITDSILFWDKENKKTPYDEILGSFRKISSRVDRIERIMKNMRLMSQAPGNIEVVPIDLNTAIVETLEFFKEKLHSHSIQVCLNLDPNLKLVLFSDIQLQQVLINLVSNAIKALDSVRQARKTICIDTIEKTSLCILKVRNNGPEIPEEIISNIFEPFFSRFENSEGMGMGLYIVTNILKCYNAAIRITAHEAGNTEFTITIKR